MRLQETIEAANAEANRLAREECERIYGLTGDALVSLLRQRELHWRHRLRNVGREKAVLQELHQELWAKYRRLARLLNRNGLLSAEQYREMR